MDPLLTLAAVFAIFIPALMLPGPDFVAVVRASMTRGTAAGLLTTCGVTIGLGFYAGLSLVGLSAVLVEYQWLAWTVRVLGGSYLIWLGLRLVFSKPEAIDVEADRPKGNALDSRAFPDGKPASTFPGNAFLFGFLVTLTNPKAVVLFSSVFATSVTAQTPGWLMALMVAIVMAASLCWYASVSLFMSSTPVIRRFGKMRHWIERAAGVCFIAIGGRILTDARNPVTP